jgi:outer membrane protein TolC
MRGTTLPLLGALLAALPPAWAQETPRASGDSLRLGALQAEAMRLDPRRRQLRLQESATELRLRSIAAERLPTLSANGQAQHQSDVTRIAAPIPGATFPSPPHDTYDAHVGAEQSLFDPALAPRREVERARLAESQAQVRATLFTLRGEITESFFAAVSLQERTAEIDAAITDLAAQLKETVARFRAGAALPGDTAAIAATLLQRRQDRLQLSADRGAALARLSVLVGRTIGDDERLAVPGLVAQAAAAIDSLDLLRARPEYEQFAATRDRLARQEEVAAARELPRVSAYGRLGYGRPGLNMMSTDFQSYWLAGLQLRWAPFNWGTTSRDRELLEIEREIVATNEAAFTRGLRRAVQPSLATVTRLDSTLALDERIIALRERIVREAQAQLEEGVITAATYVDRSTDLLTARLRRVQHHVELEQARATLLDTIGLEVP